MRRIYVEIYLSVIASALVAMLGVGAFGVWYFQGRLEAEELRLREVGVEIIEALPPSGEPEATREALRALARTHRVTAVLWNARGDVVATAGRGARRRAEATEASVPDDGAGPMREDASPADHRGPPWAGGHRRPPPLARVAIDLPGGGLLELVSRGPRRPPALQPWLFMLLFAAAIAVAAYPVSRRITRGLERLRTGVSELGEGDLSTRVEVEGRNEVADVARAFNQAAEKIQHAVESQSRMLASASHELRSPLGRLRAAVELLATGRPDLLAEAERDIAELDALIDDLLLAARLDSGPAGGDASAPVDLTALARDEAERVAARVTGGPAEVAGDPRMLRRLIRNLLENADRHGAPPIEVDVVCDDASGMVRLCVTDAGPGVPPEDRERIFEPFFRRVDHSETEHGGVGLGLALVAEIAAHHGGRARCEARDSGGSVLIVELPKRAGSAATD